MAFPAHPSSPQLLWYISIAQARPVFRRPHRWKHLDLPKVSCGLISRVVGKRTQRHLG